MGYLEQEDKAEAGRHLGEDRDVSHSLELGKGCASSVHRPRCRAELLHMPALEGLDEFGMAEEALLVDLAGTHCGSEVAGPGRSYSSQFLALR